MTTFIESVVEQAALDWLGSAGWQARHGADIALSELRVKETARRTRETTV